MAGQLTEKQKTAIRTLKPFALKMSFNITTQLSNPSNTPEEHQFAVECRKADSSKIYSALVDLLPNPDDYKVGGGVSKGFDPNVLVDASIEYKNVTKGGSSPVKEVATLLADNGVNFPGSEKLRTKRIEP